MVIRGFHMEIKLARPIKVMVCKQHYSCKPEIIVEYLRGRGYKVIEAILQLCYRTEKPINLFILVFRHDENVYKVYGITNMKGKSKLKPQCKRC